jgi:hypothetical protein
MMTTEAPNNAIAGDLAAAAVGHRGVPVRHWFAPLGRARFCTTPCDFAAIDLPISGTGNLHKERVSQG